MLNLIINPYRLLDADKLCHNTSGLVGIINKINGHTNQLKKEIQIEKKEMMIVKLENYFAPSFFIEELNIPTEKIKGFLYYLVEDKDFLMLCETSDFEIIKFKITDEAVNFLKIK